MNCVFWSIGDVRLQGMGHLIQVPGVLPMSPDCTKCGLTRRSSRHPSAGLGLRLNSNVSHATTPTANNDVRNWRRLALDRLEAYWVGLYGTDIAVRLTWDHLGGVLMFGVMAMRAAYFGSSTTGGLVMVSAASSGVANSEAAA